MDPRLVQGLNLIFHQRDQGRDYHRDPRQQQGRYLIADGFARPGGHDAQHVPPRQETVDEQFLARPEIFVAKIFLQYFLFLQCFASFLFPF